jgi:hypothetical protein
LPKKPSSGGFRYGVTSEEAANYAKSLAREQQRVALAEKTLAQRLKG